MISYDTHYAFLTPENAIQLLKPYDVVLDCLDNPQSRYLLSDACIALGKPLVTASALGFEGQLMVLNFPTMPPGHLNGGPCYRCIFPVPQPAEMTQTCGEAGILGPVVGTMGTMMALETIKVIFRRDDDLSDEDPTMLIFSALTAPQFRSIKLRSRQTTCPSCSATTKISMDSIARDPSAYDRLCGVTSPTVQILDRSERVTPEEYHLMLRSEELRARRSSPFRTRQLTADELQYDSRADYGGAQDRNRSLSPKRPQARDLASPTHILLDVRPAAHFNLTRPLSHAVNVPYSDLHTILPGYHPPLSTPNSTSHSTSTTSLTPAPPLSSFNAYSIPGLGELIHPTGLPRDVMAGISSNLPLYVVCGNGNDSQRVVRRMKDAGMDFGGKRRIVDLLGGWAAWDGGVGGRALEVG